MGVIELTPDSAPRAALLAASSSRRRWPGSRYRSACSARFLSRLALRKPRNHRH